MKKLLISLLALPFLVFSQNKLTPELLWKLGRVSEPQLSPDGKYVLYSVKTYDLTTNKGNTDIWKMDVSGSNAVKLAGTESDEIGDRIGDRDAPEGVDRSELQRIVEDREIDRLEKLSIALESETRDDPAIGIAASEAVADDNQHRHQQEDQHQQRRRRKHRRRCHTLPG